MIAGVLFDLCGFFFFIHVLFMHKTKKNKTKTQHNMCWTLLYASKQYNVNKT
jgi:hypothetical protein